MSKHKSEDYKITAVKYYIKSNKTQEEVCKIFECSPRSLMRWVERYNKEGSILAKSFTGDDGKIHIINNWGDEKDLIFVTISEWRDVRLKEIGI